MSRARLRVVLAAVLACSPALFGASLASASPASDTPTKSADTHQVTQAVPAVQHDSSQDQQVQPVSQPGTPDTKKVVPAAQQVAAQVAQARAEASKRAKAEAARKKAEAQKKAEEQKAAAQKAAAQKAAQAAAQKKAEEQKNNDKCTPPTTVVDLSATQTANARAIVQAGKKLGIGKRGEIIALSTALQESDLRNYANVNVPDSMNMDHQAVGSDHDSVGLFQQRPVAPWGAGSWGTLKELMTPETAATKFYKALEGIPGWQNLPVTVAAQRVQVSAFPSAYADDQPHATAIVNALTCQ